MVFLSTDLQHLRQARKKAGPELNYEAQAGKKSRSIQK